MPGYNLDSFRAYADRRIKKQLRATIYKRAPLLAIMAAKGQSSGLERPDGAGFISGAKRSKAKMETINGSVHTDVRIVTANAGGFRTVDPRGTNPSVERSQDQNVGSARFWWWRAQQPVKVWNNTLFLAGSGKYKIQSAIDEAVDMGLEEACTKVATKLWTGAPSTYNVQQGVDLYDDCPGVVEAMSESNSYGNVDRSNAANFVDGRHPWASNRDTTTRPASISLVDEANDVAQVYGEGIDLVLTTRAIYRKLKAEALGRNGHIIYNGKIPEYGMTGYNQEMVMYGNCVITWDPFCLAGYMACFTLADWVVEFHPEGKFSVEEWEDVKLEGHDQALTTNINIGMRPICERPVTQQLFTAVTAA